MSDILDAFREAKTAVNTALHPRGYETRSSGTKTLDLPSPVDPTTGYWVNPTRVSSKPPRWILHFDINASPAQVDIAKDASGHVLPGAETPGYVNNRQGNCAAALYRILPAIKGATPGDFQFPPDWEWIVVFAFPQPLPAGTAAETLSNFNPMNATLDYKGDINAHKIPFHLAHIGLVMSNAAGTANRVSGPNGDFHYIDATNALADFFSQSNVPVAVYNPSVTGDLVNLQAAVANSMAAVPSTPTAVTVSPAPHLVGIPDNVYRLINAALARGKRHFIFYGPPGTGKTTLAEYIAEQISEDEDTPYIELTASSSWSSQDLIGGYQPTGAGEMAFIPGVMLRDFDKPIIIDELNRCPIDKVIGPLFSVLSGQPSTLPYRVDVKDSKSDFFKIFPIPKDPKADHEFSPGPAWSMLCTLNQIDKTQLGQVSYALSRRFLWVRIGVPEDLRTFVIEMLDKYGLLKGAKDNTLPNPIADMWAIVNTIREIGGAPIIDFIRTISEMDSSLDMLADPVSVPNAQDLYILTLSATVLPLLDGIRKLDAENLLDSLAAAWNLDSVQKSVLSSHIMDLAL